MSTMTPEQHALYQSLRQFNIDGDTPALTFTLRLARENGWTPAYAGRVVDEYKRFLLLAATSTHPVTPSDQVDQAWHLHLSYTDSYWNRLCGEILGFNLHHNPTRGGDAESQKFDAWYERTKSLYERTFGHPPPRDIWPPAEVRFGDDLHAVRINTRRVRILPRRGVFGRLLSAATTLAIIAALISALMAIFSGGRGWDDLFLWSLIAAVLLFAVGIIYNVSANTRAQRTGTYAGGCGAGGCGGGGWWFFGDGGGCGGGGCGAGGCGGSGCGGGGCGGCGG